MTVPQRKQGELCYDPENGRLYKKYANGKVYYLRDKTKSNWGGVDPREYYTYSFCSDGKCKRKYAHRIIWEMHFGEIPKGMVIDHINGDTLDNRLKNLRMVTTQQNTHNRVGSNYDRGVTWNKNAKKWAASITINYKKHHLGYFVNKNDAIEARKEAEMRYHPEIYERLRRFDGQ